VCSLTRRFVMPALVLVSAIVLGACAPNGIATRPADSPEASLSTGTSVRPSDVPAESVEPSVGVLIPDAACSVEQAPGLSDAPPVAGGDLLDLSDYGPGRSRLCLTAPIPMTFEGSAWCTWNEERTDVEQVGGLPRAVGSREISAFVSFAPPRAGAEIIDRDRGGLVISYEQSRLPVVIESEPPHLNGRAAFDLAQYVNPETGVVPGAPPAMAGTMAWACGDPPPVG